MTQKKILEIANKTKEASASLNLVTTVQKNKVLKDLARELVKNKEFILKANKKDVVQAQKKNLKASLIDRLILNDKRIQEMKKAVLEIVDLPDPVGRVLETRNRHGLQIKKVSIPLGVICMIYESRPNVTIDAFSLCFKSSNAVILRGGSEAFESNKALVQIITKVLKKNKINPHVASMVPFTDRSAMIELLQLDKYIDVVIPRGGEGLMKFIGDHSRIVVIKHDKGVCGIFVDDTAKIEQAVKIIENAKVQRPGVCNSVETLYVHKKIAKKFLPKLYQKFTELNVELRGDSFVRKILPKIKKAKESDYSAEYLDLILAIKSVDDVQDAISQILKYTSNHTESILTQNKKNAALFIQALSSSCVMVNTSTRFNDGGELGLGAEIGISTTKIHAYGPMGLKELTTSKYVVESHHKVRN